MNTIEMFRRVPQEEWGGIQEKISHLPKDGPGSIGALKKGEYSHPLFKREDWFLSAVRAHLEGLITSDEYAKAMLYQECKTRNHFQVYSGHDEIQKIAPAIIATIKDNYLDEDLDAFFQSLDASDQIFYVDIEKTERLAETVFNTVQAPFFQRHAVTFQEARTLSRPFSVFVLPPGTLRKFLANMSGLRRINNDGSRHPSKVYPYTLLSPNPVNGYSRPEDFEHLDRRDVFVPNPCIKNPTPIHEIPFPTGLEIYLHDAYYHIFVENANPHRGIWTKMAVDLKEHRALYNYLLDRDFPSYHPLEMGLRDVDIKDFQKRAFAQEIEELILNDEEFRLIEQWMLKNKQITP